MKTIAIVPARAGSKGLPMKNTLSLGRSQLWEIAMMQGLEAAGEVVVTTNMPTVEYAKLPAGAHFHRRDDSLCQDASAVEDAVLDVLNNFKGTEAFVLLNPTHPFRRAVDIRECLDDVVERGFPSSTAVYRDYHYTLQEGAAMSRLNRQDRVPRMLVTGSIYAVRTLAFLEFGKLMISGQVNRGHGRPVPGPYIDIDGNDDYLCAKALWSEWLKKEGQDG